MTKFGAGWRDFETLPDKQQAAVLNGIRCEIDHQAPTPFIIEIDRVPISQNAIKSMHWGARSREKKRWERDIIKYGFLFRAMKRPPCTKVLITFCFPDMRRRDKDNFAYEKGICDSLVKADIIVDDAANKADISHAVKLGTGRYKTIIECR